MYLGLENLKKVLKNYFPSSTDTETANRVFENNDSALFLNPWLAQLYSSPFTLPAAADVARSFAAYEC
jgi:hypothetical protein